MSSSIIAGLSEHFWSSRFKFPLQNITNYFQLEHHLHKWYISFYTVCTVFLLFRTCIYVINLSSVKQNPLFRPCLLKNPTNFFASKYCSPFHGFLKRTVFFHSFRHYKVPTWSVKESACCGVGRDLYFHEHFLWGNDWIEHLTILKLFMNFEPRKNGSQKRFTWKLTEFWVWFFGNIHQNWFSVYLLNIWKD